MTLLIDKTCVSCRKVEEIAASNPDIKKLYVSNGMIQFDGGFEQPIDKRIPVLPALVVGEEDQCRVYCGEKFIMDFLNKISQENN
jgi:hypothetical protein